MAERRNQMDIVFDILRSIQDAGGRLKPTHVLYKSNLSHGRMKEYLDQLKGKGMISEQQEKQHNMIVITDYGLKFLEEYKKVREFTDAFGL
ncbi:hypothetical protein HY642_03890 [Candidatus Woesearchaeota archaeon]|nr:hypothetical protein [Candidatus Woesearchaeota archaeon]